MYSKMHGYQALMYMNNKRKYQETINSISFIEAFIRYNMKL